MQLYIESPVYIKESDHVTICQFQIKSSHTIMYNFSLVLNTLDDDPVIDALFDLCGNPHDAIVFKYNKQYVEKTNNQTYIKLNFWFSNESTPMISASTPFGQRYITLNMKRNYHIELHFTGKNIQLNFPVILNANENLCIKLCSLFQSVRRLTGVFTIYIGKLCDFSDSTLMTISFDDNYKPVVSNLGICTIVSVEPNSISLCTNYDIVIKTDLPSVLYGYRSNTWTCYEYGLNKEYIL